jgi:ankyrin repeat protein
MTPLKSAVLAGSDEIVALLLKAGADISAEDHVNISRASRHIYFIIFKI